MVVVVAALAVTAALVSPAGASAPRARCPAAATAPPPSSATAVQWQFSEVGSPTPPSATVSSSWTRGSGSWSAGHASGAICSGDSGGGARGRNLVLSVSRASTLSPHITRLGLLGVGLTLRVSVSASDDPACPSGTAGSVTLFASYYSVHRDTIALHFAAACADHDHTFAGAIVHVLIARDGHQVNSAGA